MIQGCIASLTNVLLDIDQIRKVPMSAQFTLRMQQPTLWKERQDDLETVDLAQQLPLKQNHDAWLIKNEAFSDEYQTKLPNPELLAKFHLP